jgi:hypothetical protein
MNSAQSAKEKIQRSHDNRQTEKQDRFPFNEANAQKSKQKSLA